MIKRSEIFKFAEREYQAKPDYPFQHFPHYAVLRHSGSDKWFCLVMDVPKDKLGLEGDEIVDVVDVKCGPDQIDSIKTRRGILPAYHMNKEHWVTLLLDGSLPKNEVFDLIGTSFALTK